MDKSDAFLDLLQCMYSSLDDKVTKLQNNWEKWVTVAEKDKMLSNTAKKIIEELSQGLEDTATLKSNFAETKDKRIAVLQESKTLGMKCEDLKVQNIDCRSELDAKKSELERAKSSMEIRKKQIKTKRTLMATSSEICQRILGIEIVILKSSRMQFVFRNLLPDKPDLFAFIIINVNDVMTYHITESYPALDNLTALEDTLNKTNNLAGFVQYSRRMLKAKLKELE